MVKAIIIYAAIAVVLLFFGYAKYIESRGMYFPIKEIEHTPEILGLPFEDVYINAEDGVRINGWFIPGSKAKYTLLFCHGNAGNIGHRLEKLMLLHKIKLNLFIIDYRGYGRSKGTPSEKGIYLDTKAAYDYLVDKRKIKPEQIILYGESLGSAAIIHLAAEQKVGGLIVEGGFTRGRDLARILYPLLPTAFFSDSFDSLAKIKKIDAAKLFIHSKDDEIVPFSLAQQLYAAAGGPKRFAELRGGHNSTFLDSKEKYISSITSFIQSL